MMEFPNKDVSGSLKMFLYVYKWCRPWVNVAFCNISSGSSPFAEVRVLFRSFLHRNTCTCSYMYLACAAISLSISWP